ncbi:MAG: nucleotidyltransferase family protein [Xanthomonadales bacterium]|nr:nucleotidyltransferase family protein [Xanthomonadales bacterium]
MTDSDHRVTALVLAARRPGVVDPLTAGGPVSHKCMLTIHGQIMLERVISALLSCGFCRHVCVSIDDASVLRDGEQLCQWLDAGLVSAVAAEGNLADSLYSAAQRIPDEDWPLLITTGDNALHTPGLIREFVAGAFAEPCDAALGVTREQVVTAEIPDAGLHWHWLRDGGFSACNLFLLHNRKSLAGVEIFRGGGQFGKKPWRILKAFGVLPFLLYRFRLATTEGLFRRVSRNLGLQLRPVFLPFPFGPIDVDNPKSFALSERILAQREAPAARD